MLERVRIERAPLVRRRTPGRLDPQLVATDSRLQAWATWTAGLYAERFPLGTTAPTVPRETWPAPVLELDDAVLRLYWTLASAILATYLRADLGLVDRVEVYGGLIRWFAQHSRDPRTAGQVVQVSRGRGAFQQDLDRARWSLRYALRV